MHKHNDYHKTHSKLIFADNKGKGGQKTQKKEVPRTPDQILEDFKNDDKFSKIAKLFDDGKIQGRIKEVLADEIIVECQ